MKQYIPEDLILPLDKRDWTNLDDLCAAYGVNIPTYHLAPQLGLTLDEMYASVQEEIDNGMDVAPCYEWIDKATAFDNGVAPAFWKDHDGFWYSQAEGTLNLVWKHVPELYELTVVMALGGGME